MPIQTSPVTASVIAIAKEDPTSAEAQELLSAFVSDVRKRYDNPPGDVGVLDPALFNGPRATFVVARLEGTAVGCGALVPVDDTIAELKRMYVDPLQRGKGIATRILEELQDFARVCDYDIIRLETGVKQPESIALYGKSGFYRIPNYPPFEDDATAVCFEKRI
jgi:putative acetyltransferase